MTTLDEVMRIAGGADALADEKVVSEACGVEDTVADSMAADTDRRAQPPLAETLA